MPARNLTDSMMLILMSLTLRLKIEPRQLPSYLLQGGQTPPVFPEPHPLYIKKKYPSEKVFLSLENLLNAVRIPKGKVQHGKASTGAL